MSCNILLAPAKLMALFNKYYCKLCLLVNEHMRGLTFPKSRSGLYLFGTDFSQFINLRQRDHLFLYKPCSFCECTHRILLFIILIWRYTSAIIFKYRNNNKNDKVSRMYLVILCTWQQFLCIQSCMLLASPVSGRHYYTSLKDEKIKDTKMKGFHIGDLYLFSSLCECGLQKGDQESFKHEA